MVMKVRIVADGSRLGTRIYAEDGSDISGNVTAVAFRHEAHGIPRADIDLSFIEIEAVGVPARMIGPGGKEVRRIEYADGSVDVFDGRI